MDDYISRQAAIDAMGKAEWAKERLRELPSAQPERTGRWIFDENDFLTKCSECGCHPWFGVIPTVEEATKKLQHCPNCLAKMECTRCTDCVGECEEGD